MSWLRDWLESRTWRPLWKQRQTGRRQRLSDPGHHRGEDPQLQGDDHGQSDTEEGEPR